MKRQAVYHFTGENQCSNSKESGHNDRILTQRCRQVGAKCQISQWPVNAGHSIQQRAYRECNEILRRGVRKLFLWWWMTAPAIPGAFAGGKIFPTFAVQAHMHLEYLALCHAQRFMLTLKVQ